MFSASRDSNSRQRSASRSTDDHSTKDRSRRLFQCYIQDPSLSSATTSSHHDDLPTPSMPTHAPHTTSAHSTPMTSPSTAYSSLFPGSLSSATSESAPSADSKYQSEFGSLTPVSSSAYSPLQGSASSHSSHPVSPRSRFTTESEPQAWASRTPSKYPSDRFLNRPSTAPHSPLVSSSPGNSPADHHTRSQSRLTVSIKNLLSKPAFPSPSRFSLNSVATAPLDSQASSRSFHALAAGKWPMTPRKSRPPDLEISGTVTPVMSTPGRASDLPIDAHRRYASEATPKVFNARSGNCPPTNHESFDVLIRNVPLPPVRGREPRTRNVLRRRPSGSVKLFKGRNRGVNSPPEGDANCLRLPPKEGIFRQGGVPFPLTAASAVVEAYKQQEFHCDDLPSPPKLSIDGLMGSSASYDTSSDQVHSEHSPAPYHTAFGSSSERRVQAGSSNDQWARFEGAKSQATSSHQSSPSDAGGRSLTRKISSRWRKAMGGGVISEEMPSRGREHSKGPSLQEMWGKSEARSTGRSMDGMPNAENGPWASPIANHARSGSEKGGEGSEGGKLWQLMRRISTGGLRDRFQSDKFAPPVPAIPKELLERVNSGERCSEPSSTSRHQLPSPSHDKDHARTSTAPKRISVVRPSTATVASSPNSSDVASTQFFHRTGSVRSSVSSYGEPVVGRRVPEIVLDQHIIAPLEQLRLVDDHVESGEPGTPSVLIPRSPRRSTSVPAGLRTVDAEDEHVPLLPPRCQTGSGESPLSGSSTPSSTSGSAHTSYQGRGPGLERPLLEDGIMSLSPPPRPARNSGRRGGGSAASSPPHSLVGRQVDGGTGVGGARQMDRMPSARSDMTARVESPESGRSRDQDQDGRPRSSTQLTFRELGASRPPPLSEREKADIWNDLLARSDKAGGTLHINGAAELMSDSMRFSTHSEI